ncbi:MAG TPA: DUF4843 domain-containing protein [Cyclobacteriaceae bacterium]|nr:DUF4843 domain-containing protein [Cyclobacteriaceae bacterium]
MKRKSIKFLSIFSILIAGLFASSCMEENIMKVLFEDAYVEFDAAVWNNPAVGQTYPLLNRVPVQGAATTTAAPLITRTTGTVPLRINLISPQLPTDQTFGITVDAASTAQSGVHYTVPASVTIPANSSFGTINVTILDPGATAGSVSLILELTGNNEVQVAENYKKAGISIAQN